MRIVSKSVDYYERIPGAKDPRVQVTAPPAKREASEHPPKGALRSFDFDLSPLVTRRASQKGAKKELWLSERSEFHNSRPLREAQGSPQGRDTGAFSFGSFSFTRKKMKNDTRPFSFGIITERIFKNGY